MNASIEAERLVNGFRAFQMVAAACRLRLPDLLAAGPKTADELAAHTGTHSSSLHRMLRALSAWGVFAETPDGRFAPTALSDQFRSDKPGFRNDAIMLSEDVYRAWGDLLFTVRTGTPAFEHVFGKRRFEKLAEDPEAAAKFNAAMVERSSRVAAAFIAAYEFGGARIVVDVGGGNGGLLVPVLQAQPGIRGILFDLAQGLAGAHERMVAAGVADRVTLQEGSFFEAVPSGGDIYVLKNIVHDWDDERSLVILRRCRQAMNATAKVVLLERVMPARVVNADDALSALMADLQMMVVLGGRERSTDEYRDLLDQAGLRVTRVVPTDSGYAAIEAVVTG